MALKKGEYEKRASSDLAGRELRKSGSEPMEKVSVFLSREAIRGLKEELPGLSISTGIRFVVEQYLKERR